MTTSAMLQADIERVGQRLFALIDAGNRAPTLFNRNAFAGRMMKWAMQDGALKTELFRFVDVLPTLTAPRAVVEHLIEYLGESDSLPSRVLCGALRVGKLVPALPAAVVRTNVLGMANVFIAGQDGESALPNLERLWRAKTRFTVDILGEAVVSDREADTYADRYRKLLDFLSVATRAWQADGPLAANEPPLVNLSVKLSALCARVQTAAPAASIGDILPRLMPILGRAREVGAFINLDMESYHLKELTLQLFQALLQQPELAGYAQLGVVLQAYLRDSYADAERLLAWATETKCRFTVRLVKGAYWDYEKVYAGQRTWPVPVFLSKPETDANYERVTRLLLEHASGVYPALATHNVRSIAHGIVYAEKRGLKPGDFEFQMLYGMAEPVRRALVELGFRVREYCPIGELVPGMAYLVRRLLENTSNEGFLRAKFRDNTSSSVLLSDPAKQAAPSDMEAGHPRLGFCHEPPADFGREPQRRAMSQGLGEVRRALGRTYPLVIGGSEVGTQRRMASINPAAPDQNIGWVALAGVDEVSAAVRAARKAFPRWSRTPAVERAGLLDRLAALMRSRKAELAAWQVYEVGKTWGEADADVVEAVDFCNFYADDLRHVSRPRLTEEVLGEVSFEHYIPRGVAVVLAPWNFPLAILCGMTAAALAAGNTVVVKPAEQSSVIGSLFVDLLVKAGAPAGSVNLLTGRGEVAGAQLVDHPDVDVIAFTGSREVGTQIWERAGITHPGQRNLKKVICEMGGKNALIVDGDADLDEAVLAIVQSAFSFQGQKCSALSRLVTVGDVHRRLLPRLLEATAALNIGLPEAPETDIGPMIDAEAAAKVRFYRELARREHKIAYEAEIPRGLPGFFSAPTIVTGVPAGARLAQEEVFGPLLAVSRARDLTEALTIAMDTPYGLTGGVFSRSPKTIDRVRREFRVGNLYINRGITGAIVGRHPFGGFGMSGGGTKAGGHDYLRQFMFPTVVTENTLRRGFAPEPAGARAQPEDMASGNGANGLDPVGGPSRLG
ncbi:MAG TPA: proline dehydrogenase family protein [Chthoniobacterales bacterium]